MSSNDKRSGNEMIERYVYDVTRRLPKAQRDDIDQELRTLIEDMLSGRTGGASPSKEDVEAVLIELGRPRELAAKYRGTKRHLIGPEYFDTYWLIVRIVMAATTFGITVALVVGLVMTPPVNAWETIGTYFAAVIMGAVQAFAWVTLAFALIERFVKKSEIKKIGSEMKGEWKPLDLPEVPKAKARIRPGEPIAGIVFSVIVIVLLNLFYDKIGIYILTETTTMVPIFNIDVFRSMLPLIDIILALSIVKEVFRLISGKHTLKLAAGVTLVNVAIITLTITVFLPPAIWNGDMITSLNAVADMTWAEKINLEYIWSIIPVIIVALSVFGNAVDILTSFVRGVRNTARD